MPQLQVTAPSHHISLTRSVAGIWGRNLCAGIAKGGFGGLPASGDILIAVLWPLILDPILDALSALSICLLNRGYLQGEFGLRCSCWKAGLSRPFSFTTAIETWTSVSLVFDDNLLSILDGKDCCVWGRARCRLSTMSTCLSYGVS